MTVAMALSEMKHHTSRGQRTDRAGGWVRDALHGQVPEAPTPQAAGTQYFSTAVDDVEVPAAERPAPLLEVLPQVGDWRHCGSGFELVLNATVPPLGDELDVQQVKVAKAVSGWAESLAARPGGGGGQAIVQDSPEVQVPRRRRVQPRAVRLTSQERTSARIQEQIVVAPGSQDIPMERIPERICTQIDDAPLVIPQKRIPERIVEQKSVQVIPRKRISKRIVEQTSGQAIPQERISERIVEPIVDAEMGTSSSSAAALGGTECPKYGVFRTFSPVTKSATSGPESSAPLVAHSSSWPPAAYEEDKGGTYEYFDHEDMSWRRRWSQSRYAYWFLDPDDGRWMGPITKALWDL